MADYSHGNSITIGPMQYGQIHIVQPPILSSVVMMNQGMQPQMQMVQTQVASSVVMLPQGQQPHTPMQMAHMSISPTSNSPLIVDNGPLDAT